MLWRLGRDASIRTAVTILALTGPRLGEAQAAWQEVRASHKPPAILAVQVQERLSTAGPSVLSSMQGAGIRMDAGRFTVVAHPSDDRLAQSLLTAAQSNDSFPGLPRPAAHVLVAIAPDHTTFRAWVGPGAPEWGAAVAFPSQQRVVVQGSYASAEAGDPRVVLRHELAHLALHEYMGGLPPRWFDEGYASVAAGEFSREQAFETSIGMVWRTLPSLEELEKGFRRGGIEASWSYAMAHRAVSELRALGGRRGLDHFFGYWKVTGSFERAVREAYGITGVAFEKHWQQQTRRRYGALSLVTDLSVVMALLALLLLPLVVIRRRHDRRRLDAMRCADAQQEALILGSAPVVPLDVADREDWDLVAESEIDSRAPLPINAGDRYPE